VIYAFEQVAPLGDLYVTWSGADREVVLSPPGADSVNAPTESEEYT